MLAQPDNRVQAAYQHCLDIVQGHYENFPVASLLLPKNLRRPIAVIYAFARSADDFADEGDRPQQQRLDLLNGYDRKLDKVQHGEPDEDIFIALQHVMVTHQLPVQLFHDLLTAFKQDVTQKRYESFDDVMNYCRCSANPVGRLLLHLTDQASPQNLRDSDAICSALQLINFLQDIGQDYDENGRIYLPQDEMRQFGVTEKDIATRQSTDAMRALIDHQTRRAGAMMLDGAPLGNRIPGRFGLQLRMMINGGLQVLKLVENQTQSVFKRPRLRAPHWLKITGYAFTKQYIR
ncbi:MAG: squalene synthase HpnC [Gammaproteobacteria bacterium]|jgi:squalene synthase HpnC